MCVFYSLLIQEIYAMPSLVSIQPNINSSNVHILWKKHCATNKSINTVLYMPKISHTFAHRCSQYKVQYLKIAKCRNVLNK